VLKETANYIGLNNEKIILKGNAGFIRNGLVQMAFAAVLHLYGLSLETPLPLRVAKFQSLLMIL
jgi:hypothetical protein